MPNILEVIRELKYLQAKESAGTATAADKARIAELDAVMKGQKKADPAPQGPPVRPPAAKPPAAKPGAEPPKTGLAGIAAKAAAAAKVAAEAAAKTAAEAATKAANAAAKAAQEAQQRAAAAQASRAGAAAPAPRTPAAAPAPMKAPAVTPRAEPMAEKTAPSAPRAAPVAQKAPASAPRAPKASPAGEPDANAFALSLDSDLLGELNDVDEGTEARNRADATTFAADDVEDSSNPFAIKLDDPDLTDDEPDESDAARTTFEVSEPSVGAAASDENPFAMAVPEGLDALDYAEDNQGGVTHELAENEVDDVAADGGDPYRLDVKEDFAKALDKADADGNLGARSLTAGPRGTPMVPDSHYEKIAATEASCVVQLRDGRLARGVATTFAPTNPTLTLNQLVQGKAAIVIKLEDCLTVRFVRNYTAGAGAAVPFAKDAKTVQAGEKVTVRLLDGETLVGNALPHKDGESFILIPANANGNVRRIWVSAKAVRSYTKMP